MGNATTKPLYNSSKNKGIITFSYTAPSEYWDGYVTNLIPGVLLIYLNNILYGKIMINNHDYTDTDLTPVYFNNREIHQSELKKINTYAYTINNITTSSWKSGLFGKYYVPLFRVSITTDNGFLIIPDFDPLF